MAEYDLTKKPPKIDEGGQDAAEYVHAQHEETGRLWHGKRKDIPRRYFECAAQPVPPSPDDDVIFSLECAANHVDTEDQDHRQLLRDSAAAIARLTAENEALRAALQGIIDADLDGAEDNAVYLQHLAKLAIGG